MARALNARICQSKLTALKQKKTPLFKHRKYKDAEEDLDRHMRAAERSKRKTPAFMFVRADDVIEQEEAAVEAALAKALPLAEKKAVREYKKLQREQPSPSPPPRPYSRDSRGYRRSYEAAAPTPPTRSTRPYSHRDAHDTSPFGPSRPHPHGCMCDQCRQPPRRAPPSHGHREPRTLHDGPRSLRGYY